jgi:hypothetical protein
VINVPFCEAIANENEPLAGRWRGDGLRSNSRGVGGLVSQGMALVIVILGLIVWLLFAVGNGNDVFSNRTSTLSRETR